ncbi:single-stranded-DNA-specific exonuclease RecJ [Mycoplasmatota bacterium]|nr:single-stranded-DNA-specific exonuclease RecJ [Mycoplasmatota bacterium]
MLDSQFKWNLLSKNEVNNEEELMNILFQNRNLLNDIEKSRFLSDELSLYDPFLFKDMHIVIKRINEAILKNEKIMIYGDFDVDGVTGVAILYKTLKKMNANVFYYIPNRFNEGYGPNQKAFETFVNHDFKVIITVDNGITGILEGEYLKSVEVDLIITDHHEPKSQLPSAYAILHPKVVGESYPFKDLSGSGVAFKLAHALLGEVPYDLIDLACLGTYCDMVSLHDENRTIVKWGIKQLERTKHLGLRLLSQMANIKIIDENTLGFIYGPRLNAPGRMDTGNVSVRLLTTEDIKEAQELVSDIEALNNDRKTKISTITDEAIEEITMHNLSQNHVIVVAKENWHEGVLGIICNRLLAIYHKPIIVLTETEFGYKGSARTLEDFPLHENLEKCKDLLDKFGGHKMAAGLTLKKENLSLFRERLHELAQANLNNYLKIDCSLNENMISSKLTRDLDKFRPFGINNQKPLFLLKDIEVITCKPVGEKNKHLKLKLRKNKFFLNAIAFNMGNLFYNINNNDLVDVVGTFELNEYNNTITNQFQIVDIKCSHKQFFDYRNKVFDETVYSDQNLTYLYFEKDYGYSQGEMFSNELNLSSDVVLIDLPKSFEDLKHIVNHPNVFNVYILFKYDDLFSQEHLITRAKLARIYQVYRKYKQFKQNDEQLINQLEKLGFNKKIQNISLQVFFELNFVIIKDNEIIVVENPVKRQLTESKTFQQIINQVELKEKLILSTSSDLIKILKN